MFDAGAIQAHLDVEMGLFDRKLTDAENRVKRFESAKHEVRLSAVFDNASLGRARQMFAALDNQLSRDAMQRLRGSPQGSVLGSLNALFSPHPVSGAPSPSQAASQGLLGRVARQTTPGGTIGSGGAAQQQAAQQSLLSRVLPGGGGGGVSPLGAAAIARAAGGGGGNQNQGLGSGLFKGIGPGVLGIGTRAATILGLGGAALGALPAVGAIGGAAAVAGAGLGFAALGAKTLIGTKNVKGQPATQGPVYAEAQTAGAALKAGLMAGAEGMLTPLRSALKSIPGLMRSVTPDLKQAFAGAGTLIQPLLTSLTSVAKTLLPLLGQAFRAAAPLVAPLVKGIGGLVTGLLPGLITLLKSAGPALNVFAQVMGTIGKDLGTMLTEFAPVIKPASAILKALLDVVSALFPIIGKLAAIFANALAPVFVTFAAVIKSLLPFLTVIGKLIASLAGAILTDLVAAFSAVAKLLISVAPALTQFATAISGVFTVMENSGVFAILGDALEALVKPLGALITAFIKGLLPILPLVIGFISQLSGLLIAQLVKAVLLLLPPLTRLITVAFRTLAQILPALLPLLLAFASIFTTALVDVITGLAVALVSLITAIPPKLLDAIVLGILGIVAAMKLWNLVQLISNALLIDTPFGLILIAIVALGVGIFELVKHWKTVWTEVKAILLDAWHFIDDQLHNKIFNVILAIAAPLLFLALHWKATWADAKKVASVFWDWLHQVFGTDISNFFTRTIPSVWDTFYRATVNRLINPVKGGFRDLINWFHQVFGTDVANFFTKTVPSWFQTAATNIGKFWANVKGVITSPVRFVVDNVLDGLIRVFNDITGAIGLKSVHIPEVHPFGLAAGGKITRGTGPTADDVLVRVSKDETVVSAADSHRLAPLFAAMGIPGYASGGKVGQNPPIGPHGQPGVHPGTIGGAVSKALDIGKLSLALLTGNSGAFTNAFSALLGRGTGGAAGEMAQILTQIPKKIIGDLVGWIMGQGGASGNAIADYAASFMGKIPYVWGGTAVPGGADCSGFTEAIYRHFGISAPRTSEAQGSWVKRGPPVPGGLAFFHSPAGGSDPGHVAVVRNALQVISQGGGMGPQLMNIHAMPLLWAGTPPGGFGAADKGGSYLGPGGSFQTDIISVLRSLGLPLSLTSNWLRQIQTESGGQLDAVNRTDINAQLGHPSVGILQLIPETFARYAGPYRNAQPLVNDGGGPVSLNAMAQIYAAIHYANDVYHGAAMDQVIGRGHGYAKGGKIKEPVIGFGTQTGERYSFGEKGQEWVSPAGPGGSAPAGQLANILNIMLPEGGTLAQAFAELSFRLRVAQQQGWTGVMPGG